jgi:hypothetical protein
MSATCAPTGRLSDHGSPAAADEEVMHRSSLLLALLASIALTAAAPAATSPNGSYRGKIDYQGYDITFKVKGTKITKIVARMLVDCDGSGSSTTFLIAPDAAWTIKNGRFSGKKVQTVGQAKAYVTFQGTISGGRVKGFIREWDTVAGSGIVCDTLKRTFTATRS